MAMLSVLVVALTASFGLLKVFEGETIPRGTALEAVERGPLGRAPELPGDITVDAVRIEFWDNGEPRRITGLYTLLLDSGTRSFEVAVNQPRVVEGVRYFQEQRVGYAYGLSIEQDGTLMPIRLDMPLPPSAAEASYLDTVLPNGDLLRAKCLHDPVADAGAVELVLRLVRDGEVLGERTLNGGTSVALGDLDVKVDAQAVWAILTLERSVGYTPLFTSFFVIFLGAFFIYATPPREVTLTKRDDGTVVAEWFAPRFGTLYDDEERRLREAASGEGSDT